MKKAITIISIIIFTVITAFLMSIESWVFYILYSIISSAGVFHFIYQYIPLSEQPMIYHEEWAMLALKTSFICSCILVLLSFVLVTPFWIGFILIASTIVTTITGFGDLLKTLFIFILSVLNGEMFK